MTFTNLLSCVFIPYSCCQTIAVTLRLSKRHKTLRVCAHWIRSRNPRWYPQILATNFHLAAADFHHFNGVILCLRCLMRNPSVFCIQRSDTSLLFTSYFCTPGLKSAAEKSVLPFMNGTWILSRNPLCAHTLRVRILLLGRVHLQVLSVVIKYINYSIRNSGKI